MRSVFDALKVQALSDLTRKRRVHCNPPPKGKRRAVVKDQVNQRVSLLTLNDPSPIESATWSKYHSKGSKVQRFIAMAQWYKVTMRIQNRLAKEHR